MADEEPHTGVGVFLIPEASDPIVAASSEQAHMTTIWLGDMNDLDEDTIGAIRGEIAAYVANLDGPVVVPTLDQGELGDEGAMVQFLELTEALAALRDGLLAASPTVQRVMDSVEQFPEWTPHITLGYPETPPTGEYDGDAVTFDRVGLWVGPDQEEFPMSGEKKPALAAGGVVQRNQTALVGDGPGAPYYIVPLSVARQFLGGVTAERGGLQWPKLSSLVADARSNPIDDQSDLTLDVEDGEMPMDELEDDEEEITEIPVHGVATIEARATGDGRGFRPAALSIGAMPQPLGYEYTSTHGGDTSNVAIVGRIDSYERKDIGNGETEIRWRGVIMPGKEYGAKAIESIIDGSYTGLSVVVDSVEVDVTEEREAMRQRILADMGEGEQPASEDFDIEAMLDDIVGDGKQQTTWFKSARVRRFDMVPTGAFQEAYIALGHEFADEMSEEALVAAAQALEDCGCLDDLFSSVIVDLSELTEEQLAEYEALSEDDQLEYAREHGAILASAFRDIPADERKKLADEGKALPDGSFPIANVDDLKNAIQAIGRAKDPEAARAHIKKRARELGEEKLIPEDWSLAATAFAPGTKDGPGWITHPIPTARIRRYWVRGEGAAKIKWSVPGDFRRCLAQLRKYIANPEWLAGTCANLHKEAIGVWPGQENGGRRGHSLTAAAAVRTSGLLSTTAPALERARVERIGVGQVMAVSAEGASRQAPEKVLSAGHRIEMTRPDAVTYTAQVVEVQSTKDGTVLLLEGEDVSAGALPAAVAVPVDGPSPQVARGVDEGADLLHADEVLELRLSGEFRLPVGTDSPVVTLAHALAESSSRAVAKFGVDTPVHTGHSTPPAPLFSLVAAAAPVDASFFERRELENPRVGIVVDGDAVYGYLAQWNQCHVGIQNECTLAPHSPSNYGQFRTGTVMTTAGPVAVGQLTMNTGHARGDLSARSTVAHYDNTGAAAADIACGEDRFGIWFAGRIRPNLSEEDRYALAASGRASGDWRVIGGAYELVAALVVNVPGFPIPDVSITASADLEMPVSITAAGIIRPEDIDEPVEPESMGLVLDAETIAGIATAAAEQVLFRQRQEALADSTAPARAALSAHLLSSARAKLAEITKE